MSDQSRRKLLKSLAAGSGAIVAGKSLPESWSRPVVDSVMLPAHAQTSCPGEYSAGRQLFSFTGAEQMFIVPAGVTSISLTLSGASGGNGAGDGVGGQGGESSGTLAVTPCETLYIYAGGAGQDDAPNGTTGGFNGGGDRGPICGPSGDDAGTGGGASDVRQGGNTFANRVIVAAGGGGAYDTTNGGDGGGLTGDSGINSNPNPSFPPATGGTQSAGGVAGGNAGAGCDAATAGSLGQGGTGDGNDGGGGGGGYYGGGGGAVNGAGAGGSSYIGGISAGATTSGTNTGDGQVTLTW